MNTSAARVEQLRRHKLNSAVAENCTPPTERLNSSVGEIEQYDALR